MENAKITTKSGRPLCIGSRQRTTHEPGTKNPCSVCGRLTTTKRDGVQRNHTARKTKIEK